MPASLHHESANLYRLHISGLLRGREMEEVRDVASQVITRTGGIKLMCVIERFEGWEPTEDWSDMSFDLSFGKQIEQIAIVAEEKWRDQALMFAGAGVRKAPVEFFPCSQMSAARKWLLSEQCTERHC